MSKILISPSDKGSVKLKHFRKSLVPTSNELANLNLKWGYNEIQFSIQDGKQSIPSRIFLWNYNQKIVITDVDGTIT